MTRRRAKVDANQPAVVSALRQFGATVQHLHAVGSGCPDILVGYRGLNILLEIKDGDLPPSARALTTDQLGFFETWRGQVGLVSSPEEAIATTFETWRDYAQKMEG